MLGNFGIFRRKSFERSFFQEIPWNFLRKLTFRGKKYAKKLAPGPHFRHRADRVRELDAHPVAMEQLLSAGLPFYVQIDILSEKLLS
jgi:hypothetical protein